MGQTFYKITSHHTFQKSECRWWSINSTPVGLLWVVTWAAHRIILVVFHAVHQRTGSQLFLYILALVIIGAFLKQGSILSVLSLLSFFVFYLSLNCLLTVIAPCFWFLKQEKKYLLLSHFYRSSSDCLSHISSKILFWEIQAEGRQASVNKGNRITHKSEKSYSDALGIE